MEVTTPLRGANRRPSGPDKSGFISVDRAQLLSARSEVCRKLAELDSDADGFIRAQDLVAAVESMAEQKRNAHLWKGLFIGAAVLFVLLVAALTGITFGIVKLASVVSAADGGFISVKGDNQAALVGVPCLKLSTAFGNTSAAAAAVLPSATVLRASSTDDLNYLVQLPRSTIEESCLFHGNGLQSLTVHIDTGKVYSVVIQELQGCPPPGGMQNANLSSIRAALLLGDIPVEVHCSSSTCVAFYDAAAMAFAYTSKYASALRSPGAAGSTGPNVSGNATAPSSAGRKSRRALLAANLDQCSSLLFGLSYCCAVCTAPAWYSDGRCGCRKVVGYDHCLDASSVDCCTLCKGGWIVDGYCGCVAVACFPADAAVHVLGRGSVRMAELAYGDRVLSVDRSSGAQVFREVYLFGHRDSGAVQEYVSVRTAGGSVLQLSPRHYIPVCVEGCSGDALAAAPGSSAVMQPKYASDVRVGDIVLAAAADGASSGLALVAVEEVWTGLAAGAFNPLVRGADLIVNGVVASPHSDWLLDGLTPARLRKHLPAVYEAMLAPVYALYQVVGPAWAEWLAHGVGLAEAGGSASFGAGYFAVAGSAVAAAAAVPAALGVAALRLPLPAWGSRR